MKRLIYLLIAAAIFLSVAPAFSQLTGTTYLKENVGGTPVNMVEFKTSVPTKKWLLMFFGSGERGPIDGSQIREMYNYGYQKTAVNLKPAFVPEFNILCPQAVAAYSEFDQKIFTWMIERYGKDIEIVITGHSLGGRAVMDLVNRYRNKTLPVQVVGFVSVAGEMSGPYPDPQTSYTIPGTAFHGDADKSIGPVQSNKFINHINSNKARTQYGVYRLIPGKGHIDIMTWVYTPSREAEGYRTIRGLFTWAPAPKPIICSASLDTVAMQAIFMLPDSTNLTYRLTK